MANAKPAEQIQSTNTLTNPAAAVPPAQLAVMQNDIQNHRKEMAVAYVLWFFLGVFGAHRFYLGRTGSAITMLVLSLTVIGLVITAVWAFVDLFLIPGITREKNEEIARRIYARYGI